MSQDRPFLFRSIQSFNVFCSTFHCLQIPQNRKCFETPTLSYHTYRKPRYRCISQWNWLLENLNKGCVLLGLRYISERLLKMGTYFWKVMSKKPAMTSWKPASRQLHSKAGNCRLNAGNMAGLLHKAGFRRCRYISSSPGLRVPYAINEVRESESEFFLSIFNRMLWNFRK